MHFLYGLTEICLCTLALMVLAVTGVKPVKLGESEWPSDETSTEAKPLKLGQSEWNFDETNTATPSQLCSGTDIQLYTRRYVNMILNLSGLKDRYIEMEDDYTLFEAKISISVSASNLALLQQFGSGSTTDLPLYKLDEIVSNMFYHSRFEALQEYFTFWFWLPTLTLFQCLSICLAFVFIYLIFTESKKTAILFIIITYFLLDVLYTYSKKLEENNLKHYNELKERERLVLECSLENRGFPKNIWYRFASDPCDSLSSSLPIHQDETSLLECFMRTLLSAFVALPFEYFGNSVMKFLSTTTSSLGIFSPIVYTSLLGICLVPILTFMSVYIGQLFALVTTLLSTEKNVTNKEEPAKRMSTEPEKPVINVVVNNIQPDYFAVRESSRRMKLTRSASEVLPPCYNSKKFPHLKSRRGTDRIDGNQELPALEERPLLRTSSSPFPLDGDITVDSSKPLQMPVNDLLTEFLEEEYEYVSVDEPADDIDSSSSSHCEMGASFSASIPSSQRKAPKMHVDHKLLRDPLNSKENKNMPVGNEKGIVVEDDTGIKDFCFRNECQPDPMECDKKDLESNVNKAGSSPPLATSESDQNRSISEKVDLSGDHNSSNYEIKVVHGFAQLDEIY